MRAPPRTLLATIGGLGLIAAAFLIGAPLSSAPPARAGGQAPGQNCASYTPNGLAHTCVIDVGDTWFCDASFQNQSCQSLVEAGDTIVWDFGGASLYHSATDCGASCNAPTTTPAFDSGIMLHGTYDLPTPFDASMEFLYQCQVHTSAMRGQLVIQGSLPQPSAGDVNCNGTVNSIDAALVLQLSAGLVASLPCQQFADVNEDGAINSIDSALILQFAAGPLTTLPV